MAHEYFVGRGVKKCGPFTVTQLRRIAADGRLLLTDTVWRAGMQNPVLASRVKDLFPPDRLVPVEPPVAVRPDPLPDVLVDPAALPLDPVAPLPPVASPAAPPRPPEPKRKRRAVAVKGVVLLSQDGVSVHYRKKCSECGFEDACRSTMLISTSTTRASFFCKKCCKTREVEIRGIMQ